MGKFKDKYGKTRVGAMLERMGKSGLLDKAGAMLGDIANGNYFDALKSIISTDESMTDGARQLLLNEMEYDKIELSEITKRWESDNNSDSWAARNARPVTLLSAIFEFYLMMFLDSFTNIPFEVKPMYADIFEAILLTTIIAYFGSRGIKKLDERRARNGKEPVSINPFARLKKNK